MKTIQKILLIIAPLLILNGCSTVNKSLKHGKLDVQTKMSQSIFLDPVGEEKKTVLLQIKNTSDKQNINILADIQFAIRGKGYEIVNDPNKADLIVQANILSVGRYTQKDPFSPLNSGFGGALTGGVLGAAVTSNYKTGMAVGVITGGLIESILDAAVQVVDYRIITDLQILERGDSSIITESEKTRLKQGSGSKYLHLKKKVKRKRHITRIISVASKINLKFKTALPELEKGLIRSISGLL